MCSVESLFIVDKEWIDKFEFSSSSELRDGKYPPTLCDVIKAVAIIYTILLRRLLIQRKQDYPFAFADFMTNLRLSSDKVGHSPRQHLISGEKKLGHWAFCLLHI